MPVPADPPVFDRVALLKAARDAAARAYAPYSRFRVGAAILFNDGSTIIGCNVENRSFGLTICAERNAAAAAVAAGMGKPVAVAVSCIDSAVPVPPCGACRQVLTEFGDSGCPVLYEGRETRCIETTLGALLPFDSLRDLKERHG